VGSALFLPVVNEIQVNVESRELSEELEYRNFLDASFVDSRDSDALSFELDSRWDDEEETEAREWEGDYIDERDFEDIDARFEELLGERDYDETSLETREDDIEVSFLKATPSDIVGSPNLQLESRKPWMRHFRIGTVILPSNWHWPGTQKSKANPSLSTSTD